MAKSLIRNDTRRNVRSTAASNATHARASGEQTGNAAGSDGPPTPMTTSAGRLSDQHPRVLDAASGEHPPVLVGSPEQADPAPQGVSVSAGGAENFGKSAGSETVAPVTGSRARSKGGQRLGVKRGADNVGPVETDLGVSSRTDGERYTSGNYSADPHLKAVQSFKAFIERYRDDPVGFATEVLGMDLLPWQADFLKAVAGGKKRISIRAGHGVGKSAACSVAVVWHMVTRYPQKTVCLAGDTEILCKRGWVRLAEISSDDLVWDGCEWVKHQGLVFKGIKPTIDLAGIRLTAEHKLLSGDQWVPARQVLASESVLSRVLATGSANLPSQVTWSASAAVSAWGGESSSSATAAAPSTAQTFQTLFPARSLAACYAASGTPSRPAKRMSAIERLWLTTTSAIRCFSELMESGVAAMSQSLSPIPAMAGAGFAAGGTTNTASGLFGKSIRPFGVARCWNTLSRFQATTFFGTKSTASTTTEVTNPETSASFRATQTLPTSEAFTNCSAVSTNCKPKTPNCDGEPVYDLLNCGPRSRFTVRTDRGPIIAHNCTAPAAGQLFDVLYPEVKARVHALPQFIRELFVVFTDRIVLKAELDRKIEESFVSAKTSSIDRPEAMAGVHSENVLLIFDEASGIPEAVYGAAAGSMSGHNAITILIGNPTRNSGFFHSTHHELRANWHTMHVSCVGNRLVSEDFINDTRDRWGERSNEYRVKVLGEFPLAEDRVLIAKELVDAAMVRDVVLDEKAPLVFGVDVARFGDDRSVLCKRQGNVVIEIKPQRGLDLMGLVGWIASEARTDRPSEIMVDSIGLGSGVADRLRELGFNVRDVNVSEVSAMNQSAYRLRDELWLAVKEWLNRRSCKLPRDEVLAQELVSVHYDYHSTGAIKVESKDALKGRLKRSPDMADALCLSFAGESALVGGRAPAWVVGKPLKRNLRGVV